MNRPTQPDGRVHGVIVGCRDQQGRWLLIRRSEHVAAPLKVCFPGGAVEPGEDRASAAVRELREELSLDVELVKQVWRHDFHDRLLTLFGYLGRVNGDTPKPNPHEVAEVLRLSARQVRAHPDAMPMTEAFIDALESAAGTFPPD